MNYSKINNSLILDTNVIISALLAKNSTTPPKIIYNSALDDNHLMLVSQEILYEYARVLRYEKFSFSTEKIHSTIQDITEKAISITPTPSDTKLPDPKDQPFYDLVTTKSAGTPTLITGNLKHFPKAHFVMSPRQYLLATGV